MINTIFDRLYLGTWQFSGQFRKLTEKEIIDLIAVALQHGIYKFDTAIAYGNGLVESILGKILPQSCFVTTKIPAAQKPDLHTADRIERYYYHDWIY